MTTTAETVTFEGEAPPFTHSSNLGFYDGFLWSHTGAVDKDELNLAPSGYVEVTHQQDCAFNIGERNVSFASATGFTLRSGHFAAAWNTGLTVIFKAFHDGEKVGHQTFTLDQEDTLLTFRDSFEHIDRVVIKSFGGVDGEGDGVGTNIGFDNLKVLFDGDIPTEPPLHGAHVDHHLHTHDAMHHTPGDVFI